MQCAMHRHVFRLFVATQHPSEPKLDRPAEDPSNTIIVFGKIIFKNDYTTGVTTKWQHEPYSSSNW
jgi:hypothetical protein